VLSQRPAGLALEYDTGTEPLSRVAAKLTEYAAITAPHRHHHPGPVLAAEPVPGGRAARPAGPSRRRPASATPPRPRRSPVSRSRPPPPAQAV